MRPLERLSKRQREATPLAFAQHLVHQVLSAFGTERVAVLWVQRNTVYSQIPACDLWGRERDARTYAGPWPVICHPPCGPWGKYAHRCKQSKEDGIVAMELVARWGGVVEQPVGSSLYRLYGRWWNQRITRVDQSSYGHAALKPSLLYWVLQADARLAE